MKERERKLAQALTKNCQNRTLKKSSENEFLLDGAKTEVVKIKDREIPLLTSAKCWTLSQKKQRRNEYKPASQVHLEERLQ